MKRALLCLLGITWLATVGGARAADWYNWRGPEQTGVAHEVDLPDRWDDNTNLIWKKPIGSRSAPLVMNGHVYLINKVGDGITQQERVMALDAKTGDTLWEHKFNVFHSDIVADRLGWTNLAGDPETGNIIAHGTQGFLICFDPKGKVVWSHSLNEEFGRISGYGGRIVSPIVDGDLVVIGMLNASWGDQARGGNRFLALDKKTGVPVWWSSPAGQPKDTYFSNPVPAVVGGQRILISGAGDGGVYAIKAHTGEKVWEYPLGTGAVNCTAVVDGNRVFIGHGEENPDNNIKGRVVCLDMANVMEGKPKLVWKRDGIKDKFASPILDKGRLYVADENARLYCLDAASGKQLWMKKYGRNCMGSPILADGKIYVGEVNSHFRILKPGDKGCEDLDDHHFLKAEGGVDVELNGTPAVANGRVYFTTSDEIYCIGKKDHKAAEQGGIRFQPVSGRIGGPIAAFLQVLPADVVLHPGQSASFTVRSFDNHGNFLKEETAEWSLPAPPPPPNSNLTPPALRGDISKEGKLTVVKEVPGQQGMVQAKVGELTGRARVRVAPVLPYKPDFKKVPVGATPGGWVNCQGKFVMEEKDGTHVLKKVATIPSPLVARANAFIGMPDLTNYTILADMLGKQARQDLPDMGVVANRYTLMLAGNTQQLRLVSWDALPRIDKSIPWQWKPDVWYRLKLKVEIKGDKVVVSGKVWQRDQEEPKDWTVQVEDPVPNKEGSPALYGFASGIIENQTGAEIFYDNVSVTPNKGQ